MKHSKLLLVVLSALLISVSFGTVVTSFKVQSEYALRLYKGLLLDPEMYVGNIDPGLKQKILYTTPLYVFISQHFGDNVALLDYAYNNISATNRKKLVNVLQQTDSQLLYTLLNELDSSNKNYSQFVNIITHSIFIYLIYPTRTIVAIVEDDTTLVYLVYDITAFANSKIR